MEFKLNKIDTDVRKKMQEQIKEEKIHSAKGTNNKSDIVKDEKKYSDNKKEGNKNIADKRFITIDGIKKQDECIVIDAQKVEDINEMNSKGRILDAKK